MYSTRLRQNYANLSKNDKKIVEYLNKNLNKLGTCTSYDIAEKLGISQASIIRFSKKLNYQSFQDLVTDINDSNNLEFAKEISQQDTTMEVFEKIHYSYTYGLNDVLSHVQIHDFNQIVNLLDEASGIYFYGALASGNLAEMYVNRFLEIGKKAYTMSNSLMALSMVQNMNQNDVLFVISATGETKPILKLVENAVRRGIRVVALTGPQDNSISKIATYTLKNSIYRIYASERDIGEPSIFSVMNRCTQLFILDCLYLCVYRKNAEIYKQKFNEITELLNDELGHKKQD